MANLAVTWKKADIAEFGRTAYFDDPVMVGGRYHASAEFAGVKAMLPRASGRACDLGALATASCPMIWRARDGA
jgi:hypothetical protein